MDPVLTKTFDSKENDSLGRMPERIDLDPDFKKRSASQREFLSSLDIPRAYMTSGRSAGGSSERMPSK